jgi:serine acetyltransferase
MWSELRADSELYYALRHAAGAGVLRRILLWLQSPGLLVLTIQRAGHHYLARRERDGYTLATLSLRILLPLARQLAVIIAKSDVAAATAIAGGVYLSDAGQLIIGPHSIGTGTVIHDRVTIGVSAQGAGPPTIGKNVWIGPDCVIYGDCRIGNGATVLPGTVLSMDVPDHAVVGGNPGGIVRLGFDNNHLRRSLACNIDRVSIARQ